jgi:acetoin utilization deacetylase AcuC-like enzyme
MKTVFHLTQLQHNPAKEFLDGEWVDYLESVRRPQMILAAIERMRLGEVIAPDDFGLAPIQAVHKPDYLDFLQTAYARWIAEGRSPAGVYPDTFFKPAFTHRPMKIGALAGVYTFDMSTVIVEHTWQAAYWSAQCALTAAKLVCDGERAAFALCRPPGHHAHTNLGGGYCFINNAAVAAEWLLPHPTLPRLAGEGKGGGVAILDIDFHHGNGTQAIFYHRSDVLFVSLHADPDRQYPYFLGAASECGAGEGEGYNLNIPLPIKTTDDQFIAALDTACERIAAFAPAYLLISLGVDTFGEDPLGDFAMTRAAYPHIGARLAQLNLPTVFLMEGGYAIDALGQNVAGVLASFEQNS